jgi:hypothetical protein
MSEPLPALRGLTEPEYGSPVFVYFEIAALTVMPMSKRQPVQLRCRLATSARTYPFDRWDRTLGQDGSAITD